MFQNNIFTVILSVQCGLVFLKALSVIEWSWWLTVLPLGFAIIIAMIVLSVLAFLEKGANFQDPKV